MALVSAKADLLKPKLILSCGRGLGVASLVEWPLL
jgi:hypothetical protein